MHVLLALLGLGFILLPLIDGFETILQPRRITHRFRYARFYYRYTWKLWRGVALQIPSGKRREAFLSTFGPLSLLGLFATWMLGLIVGFGLLHWALRTAVVSPEPKMVSDVLGTSVGGPNFGQLVWVMLDLVIVALVMLPASARYFATRDPVQQY